MRGSLGGGSVFGASPAFDPATNTWTPVVGNAGAPAARFTHAATWTGSEMLIWGGANSSTGTFSDAFRFDPATSTWSPLPATNRPTGRRSMPAVWTGASMLSWGGTDILDGTSQWNTMVELRLYAN